MAQQSQLASIGAKVHGTEILEMILEVISVVLQAVLLIIQRDCQYCDYRRAHCLLQVAPLVVAAQGMAVAV